MSQFAWISGLKSLRICGTAIANVGQTRLASKQAEQKPKKPLTPYFRFMAEMRPDVQKSNPEMKITEISKIVGQKWAQLNAERKQKYADGYKAEMTSYNKILEDYYKSMPPEVRELEQQEKIEREHRKEKRERRRKVRELGKPKRPPTPFLQYLMARVNPGSGMDEYRTIAKEEGARWKTLPLTEKQTWMDKYKKESEKYKKDLLKWESQMLKEGHEDVVRKQLPNARSSAKSK